MNKFVLITTLVRAARNSPSNFILWFLGKSSVRKVAVLLSLSSLAGVLADLGFHDQSVITRDIPTDQIGLTHSFEHSDGEGLSKVSVNDLRASLTWN
jgi:hypothetical protein